MKSLGRKLFDICRSIFLLCLGFFVLVCDYILLMSEGIEPLYHLIGVILLLSLAFACWQLPGLNNCPEYQELYDSARENDDDDWCWFSETMDVVAYDLSMEEYNPRRFTPTPDMEDMPELIMEEILTGKRPTQT